MKKNYKLENYLNFKSWYKNRGLGGSSIASLYGLSNYQTDMDIYLSMLFPQEKEDSGTSSAEYGKDLEPLLIKICARNFQDKFDVKPFRKFSLFRRCDYEELTASLDGIMTEKETGEKWVLEIKTREIKTEEDKEEWEGHIPQNYFLQVMHYLSVCDDFKGAYLVAKLKWTNFETGLPMKEEIRYYKFEREKYVEDIEKVNKKAIDFVLNHLRPRIPPDVDLSILRGE